MPLSAAEKQAAYRARQKAEKETQSSYDAGYNREPYRKELDRAEWCRGVWQSHFDTPSKIRPGRSAFDLTPGPPDPAEGAAKRK